MKLVHEPAVFDKYPMHRTGIVVVCPVDHDAAAAAASGLVDVTPPPSIDAAVDHWRQVFSAMGAKPRYHSSIEKLRRAHEQGDRSSAPPLVALYNAVSLATAVPMAGYDLRFLIGTLRLTADAKAYRQLAFSPLFHENDKQHVRTGEVAYIDDEKVVCRYWNWSDCHESRLRDDTSEALFVLDLIDDPAAGSAQATLDDVCSRFRTWFPEAVVTAALTTPDTTEVELDG